MARVSIIIPTYTRHDKLRECLESIVAYTDMEQTETIVVANGASEETRAVCNNFPVQLLWFDEPLGYPKAVNHGIRAATGEYIVLLNDDTVLLSQHRNEWIDVMIKPMLQDGAVGITGPLMAFDENSGHEFIIFFCVMIRWMCFKEIGLLDEEFLYFGEDTEFCIRAEQKGWKVVRVPEEFPTQLVPLDPNSTTLEKWKHDKVHTGNFRIWHDAESTIGRLTNCDEVLRASRKRLKELFGNPDDVNIHRAMVTDGWIAHDELIWLARQAKACGPNAVIVQIGTWHGKSSRAISDNMCKGSKLFDVDTFNGSSGEPDQHATAKEREGDHCFQWYWDNQYEQILKGEVIPMRMHSANAAHTMNHRGIKADMIFIDGDHSEEGIRTDVEAWLPLLKEGGLLCGHDYYKENEGPWWVHVRQFVEAKFPDVEKSATSIWHVRPQIKPVIIDCFPINDELLTLELRLNELDSVVDRWVITEAPLSHGGQLKPLYFKESIEKEPERWAKWLPRITHIIVEDYDHVKGLVGSELHWAIERHQRDAIMRGLTECRDTDIILISDADEIPKAESLKSYSIDKGLCALEMKLYYGSMNCEGLEPWRWTRILPYSILKAISPCGARYVPNYDPETQVIKDGGWHFSFMGGADEWVKKLESTPHQEYNKPEYKDKEVMLQRVRNGQDLLGRDIPYHLVEVDESFPQFVLDNIDRFKDNQFIMHPESYQFVERVRNEYPDFFHHKKVLEVGSLDINGSVRQFFQDCDYVGIDLAQGKGVDIVSTAHQYIHANTYDVVITSEMLEHDQYWEQSLKQMYANLKPGGLFILSCAGPERAEHGTTRTDTYSSPFTTDYYRNISKEDLRGILPIDLFSECTTGYDRGGKDLHFWGLKQETAKEWRGLPDGSVAELQDGTWQVISQVDYDVSTLQSERYRRAVEMAVEHNRVIGIPTNWEPVDSSIWNKFSNSEKADYNKKYAEYMETVPCDCPSTLVEQPQYWNCPRHGVLNWWLNPEIKEKGLSGISGCSGPASKSLTVTAEISTKDRYHFLPLTISAILNQTHKPNKLVIYDDSSERIEPEKLIETSPFSGLFVVAREMGIEHEIFTTPREGQVKNHQHCLDTAVTDLIWRIDDDEIPEPNCLENLLKEMKDGVGAVAGLVHHPGNIGPLPDDVDGSLKDLMTGRNIQWYDWR